METVIDTAVGFALENLKELVQYNIDLIRGAKDNADDLDMHLDTLKGFVDYCTKKHNKKSREFVEALVNQVRSVVWEAEDAIETFVYHATQKENRNFWEKARHLPQYVLNLRDVGEKLVGISNKVQEFYQNRAGLGLAALQDDDEDEYIEEKKRPLVEEVNVVGFDGEVENVIKLLKSEHLLEAEEKEESENSLAAETEEREEAEDLLPVETENGEESDRLLLDESEQPKIISIVGMPGQGKTTLAKRVMNDIRMKQRFKTRAFVYVSQGYKKRQVFLNILAALDHNPQGINNMSDDQLGEAICKHLETRKYLIIMDDVWTPGAWDDLITAFRHNNKGSRVLITTRYIKVANHANRSSRPYRMGFLNEEYSKKLLRRMVFGGGPCPSYLEEYETEIAKKCRGLPLTLVLIAGFLSNHRDISDYWQNVAQSVNVYADREEQQSYVIKLSYHNLPHHLKFCFLYLGVFQQDFDIPAWKLLRLWIAEGFVKKEDWVCLEDSAEYCLEELVARNLVIVGQRSANGKIKTCRVHDILRDFCRKEAKNQKFFQEINSLDEAGYRSAVRSKANCRRLCINSNSDKDFISTNFPYEHVRSFLSFVKKEATITPDHFASMAKTFKLLKVLDTRSISFPNFPDQLSSLVLLKYMAIFCNSNIQAEKMSNLQNLQTVIIESSDCSHEIGADIWKMPQLRYLYTKNSKCLLILPVGNQRGEPSKNLNLQTLSTIAPESCRKDVFERTPNIKKLAIRGELDARVFGPLSILKSVEHLKLWNETNGNQSKLLPLPNNTAFPSMLRRLTLQNTLLHVEHISAIGKLQHLVVLKVKKTVFHEAKWKTEDKGFVRLQVLHIEETNLVEWKTSASHFPKLTCLILRRCKKLDGIPSELAHINDLQKIELYRTNHSVVSSAESIELLKFRKTAQSENSMTSGFQLIIREDPDAGSGNEIDELDQESSTQQEPQESEVPQELQEARGEEQHEREVPEQPKKSRSLWNRIFGKRTKGSNGK